MIDEIKIHIRPTFDGVHVRIDSGPSSVDPLCQGTVANYANLAVAFHQLQHLCEREMDRHYGIKRKGDNHETEKAD